MVILNNAVLIDGQVSSSAKDSQEAINVLISMHSRVVSPRNKAYCHIV